MDKPRKNILVCVVGMTPQVVTETLYALTVKQGLKVSEIYVLTTAEGKNTIAGKKGLRPLADETARLAKTYDVEVPTFSVDKNCFIVKDESLQIADIDSGEKSLAFFNGITELIRKFSTDPDLAIHCSIAGGRKTMGLAAGYAMSLFGRPQDRLSHVLASKGLEDSKKFFPEPDSVGQRVILVDIPFIRLRDFVDLELSNGSYSDLVKTAQTRVDIRTGEFGEKFGIIGRSQKMQEIFASIEDYSRSNQPVLIIGESGTGKELVADAIHKNSKRAHHDVITVNCASLSDNLLQSELFGHVRGAFTGAIRDKEGLLEKADKGTVFLDEVTETSVGFQSSLLRVLQKGEFRRVGDTEKRKTTARVIAATNRVNLEEEIRSGRFREDLYYRLNVLSITVPPLRDHKEDILDLVYHFVKKSSSEEEKSFTGLSEELLDDLQTYDFPGNIRQLENVIRETVVRTKGKILTDKFLDGKIKKGAARTREIVGVEKATERVIPFHDLRKSYLINVLSRTNGNRTKAAQLMKLDSDTVSNWIKKYGIEERDYRNIR